MTKIVKKENRSKPPKNFSNSTIYLLEFCFSTILVFMLCLPGAFNIYDTVLSSFLQAINQINCLMAAWIVFWSQAIMAIGRRFLVKTNLLSLIFAKAKNNIANSKFCFSALFQLIGAFIGASFIVVILTFNSDPNDLTLSSFGAVSPTIRGILVYTSINSVMMSNQIWFYFFQAILSSLTIIFAATVNIVIEKGKFTTKKTFLLKVILLYGSVLITIRFSSHPVNLWRIIAPTILKVSMGGQLFYLFTMLALVVGHLLGYTYILKRYSKNDLKTLFNPKVKDQFEINI